MKALRRLDRESDEGRDSTVHEVRKRIKKARALIRLARGSIGRGEARKAGHQLREAAHPLSAVRDAAVLLQTFDALANRADQHAQARSFAEVRVSLEVHRDQVVREQLDEANALGRVSKALRATRRRMADWDPGGGRPSPIGAYRQAYRRGRDASKIALRDRSAVSLHELRKRVKALDYQLRTIDADPSGPLARLQRLAGLLADELGEVHDLDVLRAFVKDLDESSPILVPLDRRRLGLRRSALRRARVVFSDKPRAFARTLEAAAKSVEAAR